MSPVQGSDPDRLVKQIQEAIVSTSTVREGLPDDQALPLIDWGATCAEQIARRMAAPDAPEPDAETVDNTAYSLTRLLTRVNWLVVYRHKKDAAWLTRTFLTINQLSRELYGESAPTFSEQEIAAWIADHPNHANDELLQGLIARLTPPPPPDSPPALPGRPDALPGSAPGLPGRPHAPLAGLSWLPGRLGARPESPPALPGHPDMPLQPPGESDE